jgi:hypothetical protein
MFLSRIAHAQQSMSWRIWTSSAVLLLFLAMVLTSCCHVEAATEFCRLASLSFPSFESFHRTGPRRSVNTLTAPSSDSDERMASHPGKQER